MEAVVPKIEHYYYYSVPVHKLLQNLTAETLLCTALLQRKLKPNIVQNQRTTHETNAHNKKKARKYKMNCRLFTLND